MSRVRIKGELYSLVLEKSCCDFGRVSFALRGSWNRFLNMTLLCSMVFYMVSLFLISLCFLGILFCKKLARKLQ